MAGPSQPPPTMNNPASGPVQLISSLWTTYGPSILAGGAALMRQTAAPTLPGVASNSGPAAPSHRSVNPLNTPPGSVFGGRSSNQEVGQKKFDVELDQLSFPMPQRIPGANNPAFSTSSPGLRARTNSGKFDEIKESEFDGYEVDGDEFVGEVAPQQPSRASWFGWAQGSRKDGYDRLKTD